jgi:hypothetical protein
MLQGKPQEPSPWVTGHYMSVGILRMTCSCQSDRRSLCLKHRPVGQHDLGTLLIGIFSTHFTQPAEIATILGCERPSPAGAHPFGA